MACVNGVCTRVLKYTGNCLELVREAAEASVSWRFGWGRDKWLKVILSRGYTSVLEHCSYTFEVRCSRVCSHQLVRHRIASYTQLSQRRGEWPLTTVSKMLVGVEPRTVDDWGRVADSVMKLVNNLMCYDEIGDEHCCLDEHGMTCGRLLKERVIPALFEGFVKPPSIDELHWSITVLDAIYSYAVARASGAPPEDARYLLPQSVKTVILVTMNARELVDVFLPLRLCARAQWEIRTVAWLLLEELKRIEPDLWAYAGPRCLRTAQLAGRLCKLDDMLEGRCSPGVERCPEGVPREKIPGCIASAMSVVKGSTGQAPR